MRRTNQDFLEGQRRLRGLLGTMREDVRPGFGRLTESGVNAIRQKAAEASGNLRAQMGRRGLAGASFADDQLSRVAQTYDQAENEFRNQAFIQEMQMTSDLIDKEAASLNNQAQHELTELGIATAFLNSVNQVGVTQAQIDKILSQEKLMAQFGQQQPGDPTKNPAATPPGGETPKPRPAGPRPTSPRPPQGTRPQQPFNLFGGLRP